METAVVHEQWSSRRAFLLAAIGSAVGLGNIWRFPYVAGVNGGGAFVIIYVLCIAVIGVPLVVAELAIGRRGGGSAVGTMHAITQRQATSRFWNALGWQAMLAPIFGLMYYSVVAGWTLDYALVSLFGSFRGVDAEGSGVIFGAMTSNEWRMLGTHALFLLVTAVIVAAGVRHGLERAVKYLMPALFVLLLVLIGYAAVTADFMGGLRFMFAPDFSKVTPPVVLMAIGQAFFSVSVGVGAFITYGAYVPKNISIPRVAATVAFADTGVALMMGLVIFPLVLTFGLHASEGPGLVFVTLPVAFGNMPAGAFFGSLFFLLMAVAALTSALGMLEPVVSLLQERGFRRPPAAFLTAFVLWVCGIPVSLSFNRWAEVAPLASIPFFAESNVFALVDFATANILIPVGGLLIALFAGWVMTRESLLDELGMKDAAPFWGWRFLVRFVAPVAILVIFVASLA